MTIDLNDDNEEVHKLAKNLAKTDTILSRVQKIREISAISILDQQEIVQFRENVLSNPVAKKNIANAAFGQHPEAHAERPDDAYDRPAVEQVERFLIAGENFARGQSDEELEMPFTLNDIEPLSTMTNEQVKGLSQIEIAPDREPEEQQV